MALQGRTRLAVRGSMNDRSRRTAADHGSMVIRQEFTPKLRVPWGGLQELWVPVRVAGDGGEPCSFTRVSNPSILKAGADVHKASLLSACEGSRSGAAGLFTVIRAHSVTPGPRRCDVQARQTRPGAIRHQVLIFVSRGAMPGPIDDPKRGVTRGRRPMAPTASDRTEERNGKGPT